MNRMLLNRKALSRERSDSTEFSVRSCGSRRTSSATLTRIVAIQKPANQGPSDDLVKECTDEMTPLRVMKVPNIERQNVITIRMMFQTFSIPFFSWIMTE